MAAIDIFIYVSQPQLIVDWKQLIYSRILSAQYMVAEAQADKSDQRVILN